MRKLIESTFVSLDGVVDDTRPSTAPRAQPQHWGRPYWDDDHNDYAMKLLTGADAFLLGRCTAEAFAEAWSTREGPDADAFNQTPKYVASRTITEMDWSNTTVLQGDAAGEVARLKEGPGRSILKWGTGELDRALIEHGLIDEFHFWYFPVVVGAGRHLFEGTGLDTVHLELADIVRFASGIAVHVYVPK